MSIDPATFASASALLRGAEAHLRSAAIFDDRPGEQIGKFIGRQPAPGRPPAQFGSWYAALHFGGARGADGKPQSWDVYLSLVLTLTVRLAYSPADRRGVRLTTPNEALDLVFAFAGPLVIHGSYPLLAEANKLTPGTREHLEASGGDPEDATVNGFVEPLVLDSIGPERPGDKDWISSSTAEGVYVYDIKFKDARHKKPMWE